MAKSTSQFDPSGSIGDLTFARTENGTIIRNKSSLNREKFYRLPKLKRARENAQGLGGASMAACPIYANLKSGKAKRLMMPYAHNRITKRLKNAAAKRQHVVDEYTFRTMIPALHGLDLSREVTARDHIKTLALGSHHNPDSIRLTGLLEAANAIQTNGQSRIECRIQLKYIRLAETRFNTEGKRWEAIGGKANLLAGSPRTDWIPTDILPNEGQRLQLEHPLPAEPVLIFLFVEWREVNEVTDTVNHMYEKAVVRLVAMQYSAELAAEIAQDEATHQAEEQKLTEQGPALWRTDPKAYLQTALKGFAVAEDGG